mgnify:CR=1 FL=1
MPEIVTAAMLVIGDEILSGRTKDRNIGHLADIMTAIGIDLKEVRIVPDEEDEIVAAVNAVRARYTYVFTTGGIGPTHDDITADSIAKAFGDFAGFQAKIKEAALGRFGSGWAWLVSADGNLKVISSANQDSPFMEGQYPVFGVDVWEHAYYLKYQNKRADYVDAWWNVVNWSAVDKRFAAAKSGK